MRFRPCIDIHQGKVKQIVGSTLSDGSSKVIENFVAEKPAKYFSRLYKADSLTGGHVILLDSGEQTKQQAVEALMEYPRGFGVGGGINDTNANYWLDKGASHVIITSFVFKDGKINLENLDKIVETVGKKNIILDLSCRKKDGAYFVMTDKWQKFTAYELNRENFRALEKSCAEFLIHGVDVEGKSSGILEDLVGSLSDWANIPTTYAGGVGSILDLERIKNWAKGK